MPVLRWPCVIAFAVWGCQAQAPTSAPPTALPAVSVAVPEPVHQEDAAWRERLLVSDYRSAAALFDAQHPAPSEPALRFVRGRIAFELGEHARALELWQGLQAALPQLAGELERLQRNAKRALGPELDAARALAESSTAEALQGAEMLLRLGAHAELEQVLIRFADNPRRYSLAERAAATRLRAQLAEAKAAPEAAAKEWLWLSQNATVLEAGKDADEQYERLGKPLLKAQRYARAEAFAGAGQSDAAERELNLMQRAAGDVIAEADVTRTRAWARYNSRRDYAKAAELFELAAKSDPKFRVQDTFFAARSLSRDNRDALAIERYRALIARYPDSRFAEEAQFLVARLHQVLGQWAQAVDAASTYLARHGKAARFAPQARYGKAISLLVLGRGRDAERELGQLLKAEAKSKERALLSELLAVSLAQQGKNDAARAQFEATIREQPLSFAALAAASRLAELGQTVPPPIAEGAVAESIADEVRALAAPAIPQPPWEPARWELPASVALLHQLGLDADAESALERDGDGLRTRYEPRGDEVLCAAYGELSGAGARYRHAQRVVRERVLQRAIEPATRWLWECIYPEPYPAAVKQIAAAATVPTEFVYAVMRQESAFEPNAGSPVGARGLMQLMPETARTVAVKLGLEPPAAELHRPWLNLQLGTAYLGELFEQYRSVTLAAAGYNAGPAALERWLAVSGALPMDLFVATIPYRETREYCQRVTGNWARYHYLHGGTPQVPQLPLRLPPRG